MKKALVIHDAAGRCPTPPAAAAQVLEDVYDGMYALTCTREYARLTAAQLRAYHTVILAGTAWDAGGSRESTAALLSYAACGGSVLALGDALRAERWFEMNCLLGARLTGEGTPCLLDLEPAPSDGAAAGTEPFSLVETPLFCELDPILAPEVLLWMRYAGGRYPAAWRHRYGWGRVLCVTAGNLPSSYLPPLRGLLWRAGAWLLNRL